MKKPGKINFGKEYDVRSNCDANYVYGYNQACSDWEKFLLNALCSHYKKKLFDK